MDYYNKYKNIYLKDKYVNPNLDTYERKYLKYKLKYLKLKYSLNDSKLKTLIGGASTDEFIKKVNDYYETTLEFKGNHRFFQSHSWWMSSLNDWRKMALKFNDKKMIYRPNNINEIKSIDNCIFNPKAVISRKKLLELYNLLNDESIKNFETIRKKIDPLFNYNLPSSIKNIDEYLKTVKDSKDTINILIVGAGPVGLFTALYLNHYYNELMYNIGKKINILLIDNRIYKEGIKKPYIRSTQFGFDIRNFQPLINQIFCWKLIDAGGTRKFDFIHILELLLYITAFGKNIPMYFTKKYETYDKIEELCNSNNFHYIFDCTGGRLKTTFTDNLSWNKYDFKKDNFEIKLDNDNYYKLYIDGKLDEQIIFLIYMYDKNMKQIPNGTKNYITDIDNEEDLILIKKFANKCFEIKEYLKLAHTFKDKVARNLLSFILHEEKIKNAKYIKVSFFNSISRHYSFCAKKINKSLTYFAVGDTLGNTEFGIWFGMKHSILLVRHIIHLLESYHSIPIKVFNNKF